MSQRSFAVREEWVMGGAGLAAHRTRRVPPTVSTVKVRTMVGSAESLAESPTGAESTGVVRLNVRSLGPEGVIYQLHTALVGSAPAFPDVTANLARPGAFLTRALAWVRLSESIIAEKTPTIRTIVFEHVDAATEETQRDVARIIQFHRQHRIERTFVLVVDENTAPLTDALCGVTHEQRPLPYCA